MKILSQSFNQDSKIRILLINEKEFFVGKDIATLLVKTQNGISILETLKINFENLLFLPTELGKFLGISPIEMNQNLREKGLQIKTDGVWKLTETGRKFGVDVSETFSQIKWKIEVLFL